MPVISVKMSERPSNTSGRQTIRNVRVLVNVIVIVVVQELRAKCWPEHRENKKRQAYADQNRCSGVPRRIRETDATLCGLRSAAFVSIPNHSDFRADQTS